MEEAKDIQFQLRDWLRASNPLLNHARVYQHDKVLFYSQFNNTKSHWVRKYRCPMGLPVAVVDAAAAAGATTVLIQCAADPHFLMAPMTVVQAAVVDTLGGCEPQYFLPIEQWTPVPARELQASAEVEYVVVGVPSGATLAAA